MSFIWSDILLGGVADEQCWLESATKVFSNTFVLFFFFFPSRPAAGLLLLLSLSREHHRFIGISVRLLLLSSPWVPFLLDIGPRSHFHGYLTFKELCLLAGYFKYSARRSHHMHTFPHILYLILCYSRSCCSVKCAQNCTFYSKQKWTQFLFLNLIH